MSSVRGLLSFAVTHFNVTRGWSVKSLSRYKDKTLKILSTYNKNTLHSKRIVFVIEFFPYLFLF